MALHGTAAKHHLPHMHHARMVHIKWPSSLTFPLILFLIITCFYWKLVFTYQYDWIWGPDLGEQILPWFEEEARQIQHGHFPLWDQQRLAHPAIRVPERKKAGLNLPRFFLEPGQNLLSKLWSPYPVILISKYELPIKTSNDQEQNQREGKRGWPLDLHDPSVMHVWKMMLRRSSVQSHSSIIHDYSSVHGTRYCCRPIPPR